jgi:hypothetical protein
VSKYRAKPLKNRLTHRERNINEVEFAINDSPEQKVYTLRW